MCLCRRFVMRVGCALVAAVEDAPVARVVVGLIVSVGC